MSQSALFHHAECWGTVPAGEPIDVQDRTRSILLVEAQRLLAASGVWYRAASGKPDEISRACMGGLLAEGSPRRL